MTDINGHRHRNTIPMGLMRDEAWSVPKEIAARTLASPIVELVTKTARLFITVANETAPCQASYRNSRVLFIEDALTTTRRHAGLSTN